MDPVFPLDNLVGTAMSQKQIVQQTIERQEALIRKNSDLRPRLQLRIPLALDTAATAKNPLVISDPFNGFYVESATDGSTYVQLSLSSPEDANLLNYTKITNKDSAYSVEPIKGCYLTWPAQAGKTLTLVFYIGVEFKPGSFLLALTGGVTVTTGTGMTPNACVSVSSAATLILASDTTRKLANLTNLSGQTVWVSGTSGVKSGTGAVAASTLVGVPVPPYSTIQWSNTGDIYGIVDAGTSLIAINVEA